MRSSHNPGQKKSLLKLFQQLTALHFTRANNLLLGYEQQFTIVIHKNLHECLLAIKIYNSINKS